MERIEAIVGFVIVFGSGLGLFLFGLWAGRQTKPVGFWANGKRMEPASVTDISGYNRAFRKLLCVYAVPYMLAGAVCRWPMMMLILLVLWGAFGTWWLICGYKRIEKQYVLR